MRVGTSVDFEFLREVFGMKWSDLVEDREMRATVVRFVASRFNGESGVLTELLEDWELGRLHRRNLLREIVSRVCGSRQVQMQACLDRVLGAGWELKGLGAWE